jgi:DNA-binding LacI/PurR family transcriptional regulator
MAVTVYDIAETARVSPATVSRVLNGSTLVSQKTKERVLAIAAQLNYNRNPEEKLVKKHQTIAVFISNVLNPTLAQMVKGVQSVLKNEGYSMVLFDSDGKIEDEYDFLREIKEHDVAGLVLSSPHFSSDYLLLLKQVGLPYIMSFGYTTDPDTPCVYVNNLEASFKMMHILFEYGHRNIGIISGPTGDLTISHERLRGCRLAYVGLGLEFSPNNLIEGDYSVESGYVAAKMMMEQWPELPTAVFAFNDMMAIGALNAFTEKGIKVPEEISLAGFDDIEFSALVKPALTTVRQPSFQIGQESAQMLLQIMNEAKPEQLKKERNYEIIIRESVIHNQKQ